MGDGSGLDGDAEDGVADGGAVFAGVAGVFLAEVQCFVIGGFQEWRAPGGGGDRDEHRGHGPDPAR